VSIVAFIVVLCALVVIHEFGHFIVAKLLGIGERTLYRKLKEYGLR